MDVKLLNKNLLNISDMEGHVTFHYHSHGTPVFANNYDITQKTTHFKLLFTFSNEQRHFLGLK